MIINEIKWDQGEYLRICNDQKNEQYCLEWLILTDILFNSRVKVDLNDPLISVENFSLSNSLNRVNQL